MNSTFSKIVLLFSSIVLFNGCSGDGGTEAQVQQGDTQGKILAIVSSSSAPDSDGDYLPDDVEVYLGTNPHDRDTDHDGIPDFAEVFGTGAVNEAALIPDKDSDGAIAAVDQDDTGDGINDGEQVDSDGDGISNYLEYYGFTYNWMNGQYAPWDGKDYSKTYYKTDPHQKSTDQDPFDDNVEVTGVNMDVSVAEPGSLPMVPAYPDIVVRLEGYSVTLNREITVSEGESLAEGTTWERTAENSHSNTTEKNWEIGISTTVSYGTNLGGETTFHANYGEKYGSASGTSNSISSGGSILSEQNWSRASMSNPTDAAHIKLFLKVYNRGTAVASKLIPTITLKVGGHNIATFEQGNAQINLLEPGGVYPEAPGVYWVIDTIDTGVGVAPISLTLGELKALESGAPVSITLTQMSADVMLRNPESGVYETAGDWNEYMARIKAVSANLFFDRGDGNFVRAFVYADDSLTSPVVNLGDVMVWSAKGRQDPVTNEVFITYYDEASKSFREASLAGWHFAVDGETYQANGFTNTDPMPAGFDIASLRLKPGSLVVAKAPRAQVPNAGTLPQIQVAYYDPTTGGVNVVANDYNGIKSIEFVDKYGAMRAMQEDVPGSAFYVYAPALDSAYYPSGYVFNGSERVRVTNVNNESMERLFITVYTPPLPEPPQITSISADLELHKLYSHITSTIPLDAAPAFVRVYGEIFQTPAYGDGYCEMRRVSSWFQDPTGWVCDLDPNWTTFSQIQGITVVAYAGPNLLAYREVTSSDQFVHTTGKGSMGAMREYEILGGHREIFDTIDLDTGNLSWYLASTYPSGIFKLNDQDGYQSSDVWLRIINEAFYVHFGVDSLYLGKQGDAGVDFNSIDRGDIQGLALKPGLNTQNIGLQENNVFVFRTNDGRYGKLRVNCWSWWQGDHTAHGIRFPIARIGWVDYEFVTFQPAP